MIYLDYAANSKVDKEVLDTFYNITDKYFINYFSTIFSMIRMSTHNHRFTKG